MPTPNTALIVVDMITSYDFEDAEQLLESAREVVPVIADLVRRAAEEEVLTVYVNDNFGAWQHGRTELVQQTLKGEYASLVEPIAPEENTAFVVKARHSAFYETPLEYVLREAAIERVVLTGQVTEQCILYSALDAYIRKFSVAVPPDAVAHIHPDLAKASLKMMERNMSAEIAPAAELALR